MVSSLEVHDTEEIMATAEKQIKEVTIVEPKPIFTSKFWDQWLGKTMVIQTKGKAIVKGKFTEFRNTFLRIEDAEIVGARYTARPTVVMVDRNFISHFHEECPVEETLDLASPVHAEEPNI